NSGRSAKDTISMPIAPPQLGFCVIAKEFRRYGDGIAS
ncbi:MAG: hypothetical protein QOC73_421, partial [Actinomycetota bacterium]|nr:hypothetical protein [Actinomycetota bacterium]